MKIEIGKYYMAGTSIARVTESRDSDKRGTVYAIRYVQTPSRAEVISGGSSFWWDAACFGPITDPIFGIPIVCQHRPFTCASHSADVIIGCTDSLDARRVMKGFKGSYWLDMGNTMDSGQVILGGHGLPNFSGR